MNPEESDDLSPITHGVWGKVYWCIVTPSHSLLFMSMLKQMTKAAGVRVLSGPSYVSED